MKQWNPVSKKFRKYLKHPACAPRMQAAASVSSAVSLRHSAGLPPEQLRAVDGVAPGPGLFTSVRALSPQLGSGPLSATPVPSPLPGL